ncbi:LPS export ABC transporter permease LptF [Pseudaminobacter sp. 19-2017]|uniref:LPS export ABC transporter permease LptF n=1 Tax=Pseudaminobacter soli (ex Zhang et al. 2022) TaxID=2831468 RepID=A0A942I323_9HYPH|nr:LPS export ABC transporter permease LptF [Pseudaminobacter soli]MBS3650612.1 LPS export ABC transporter permease LptF [Pseudaminobacter soli]
MMVIERYILKRTVEVFLAALFWTLAIVWTTQVLTKIDVVTDSGQSALTFFEIAALILPSMIPIVVPFALVIAVAQTLSAMNADSELAVINAAGSSRMAVIRPILVLAAIASVFCFVVDNGVEPSARERTRQLVAAARADLLSLLVQEGTFRKIEDGVFVQIGERLPDGQLGGIFVADSRQEGTDLAYYAKTGAVVKDEEGKDLLVMRDGQVHRKTPSGDVSVVRFSSYALDLSAFSKASDKIKLYPKDRTLNYLFDPDPNDPEFQDDPRSFTVELHRRFSEWLYPLIFAVICVAVAGDPRSHREGRVHPLISAIAICLLVRWLGFFATDQSESSPWLTFGIYLVPAGSTAIAAWFIFNNRTMELPMSWFESLQDAARKVRSVAARLWARVTNRRAMGGRA